METNQYKFCNSLTHYSRRVSKEVDVGGIPIGGNNPIRIQSMTTVDTMDTFASVEQIIRMIQSGCEYVRITAPSIKEAKNLENIKNELTKRGYSAPIIADIHFTPSAAEIAAKIVEKVRINPGNYADKKKFKIVDYSNDSYKKELDRIRKKFTPLVEICKSNGTAMRIGTNHGSLSDRIMNQYGDTPLGMVESALEFLRICNDLNYHEVVLSMKASNTLVMVQAYRLLVNKLEVEKLMPYPLHLGVTEAGDGVDGRIKSAVGIGTLLEDGLGDTVRVSLTEEPEMEAPVAKILVDRYTKRNQNHVYHPILTTSYNPFDYFKRKSKEVVNFGGENVPRIIADLSKVKVSHYKDLKSIGHYYLPELDKWKMNDLGADAVYSGNKPIPFMLPNGLKEILDYQTWRKNDDRHNKYPLFDIKNWNKTKELHLHLNFLSLETKDITQDLINSFKSFNNLVIILSSSHEHTMADIRMTFLKLNDLKVSLPIIINKNYEKISDEQLLLHSSTDIGGLFVDGFGDGIILSLKNEDNYETKILDKIQTCNTIGFGILQSTRQRMTKTEYISCPSCGRTLFDLQETTAKIRKKTDHLKGVKIGIMGCIVNGPGEMADADYGYVGSGKGKITLYKGKEIIKRNVSTEMSVDELERIIKDGGDWIEK